MKTKDVKNMLDILTTEVKINEIDKEFLNNVPKKPMPAEKLRIGRIIVPIILCLFIAFLFIVLMIVSIKSPFFNNQKANPLTNTKRNITYQMINLLDQILETAMTLNMEEHYFVGEAMDAAIEMYSAELSNLKCEVEFTSTPFIRNPKAKSIIERLKDEIKYFKTKNTLTDADCLNFITTHLFSEEVRTLDECYLGLSKFLLFFMPNATNGRVEPDIDLSTFNYTYSIKLPMNILKFYCYFNYGLDAIFSNGRNTDLRDIAEGKNFDYSLMDLSLFDDPNMTREFKLSGYSDQLTKLQRDESALSASYQKQMNNLKFDKHLWPFVTPFSPIYRPKHMKGQYFPTVDFSHEREWRVPHDYPFTLDDVKFVVIKRTQDLAMFPQDLVNAIGIEKFIIMENYKFIETLWPVHII